MSTRRNGTQWHGCWMPTSCKSGLPRTQLVGIHSDFSDTFPARELHLRPPLSFQSLTSRHHNIPEYLHEHPTSLKKHPWRSTRRGIKTRSRCSADAVESGTLCEGMSERYDVRYMTLDERQELDQTSPLRGGRHSDTHSDSGLETTEGPPKEVSEAGGGFYGLAAVNVAPAVN